MGVSTQTNAIRHGGSNSELSIIPPSSSPAETLKISPENLEIANTYLACQSIPEVSRNTGLPTDMITTILAKREVRAYVDMVFQDFGYNNKFKMRSIMDAVLNKKLQEMDESDIGSQKDIVEIMALSHKMAMDILDRQIKLAEAEAKVGGIKNQVNVQLNNNGGGGSKYENLLQQLIRGKE